MIVYRLVTDWVPVEENPRPDETLDLYVDVVRENYLSVAGLVADLVPAYSRLTVRDTVSGDEQEWMLATEPGGRLRWERMR